jgi:arylsulfatase A-like enzyme
MEIIGHPYETEFVQGKSLISLIKGQTETLHPYVTMGFFASEDRCIRDETWSYIRRSGDQQNELYNLIEDPKETKNLVKESPEKAKEMDDAIAKVFDCRLQKEHMNQLRFDVPGLCEKRFPPVRYWKK